MSKNKDFNIALISDELTYSALKAEANIINITPINYWWVLNFCRPDFVFVESAWKGRRNAWKYKIASYPDVPQRTNKGLKKVVDCAKNLGIPCIFWNKEDGVHFERFIGSAALFDTVFTVDENCVPRYREVLGEQAKINVLPFPVQPAIHHPAAHSDIVHPSTCFVGSYSHHIHDQRRAWQDMMFAAAQPYGLTVYDRNSDRKSQNYRYPEWPWIDVKDSVSNEKTADIYRKYLVQFNVNTVTDSPTMYSRRLVEALACGCIVVTNPALSVDRYFSEYCEIVHSREECDDVLARIFKGGGKHERERARAGADYVLREYTWEKSLAQIAQTIGL
ncbi:MULTISPECIES: CgeB family protein [Comamonas]|uniref:CgeB family protein n=1 Tax=Comamonas TaxID=283 RepID=UPI00237D38FE|nr:glycosyltransferase [Comamonas aquatica]MDE1556568.1 glycosyltransferase [Comamonas aquatica]